MNTFLKKPPVLWFLFLFNAVVAVVAPFVVEGGRGVVTAVGMGLVSLGAAAALVARSRSARTATTNGASS